MLETALVVATVAVENETYFCELDAVVGVPTFIVYRLRKR